MIAYLKNIKKITVLILLIISIFLFSSGSLLEYLHSRDKVKNIVLGQFANSNQITKTTVAKNQENTIEIALKVVNVLDGDTIELNTGEKIRYLGINAPEKGQPYSSKSTAKNKELVSGKTIRLEYDLVQKDKYGRILAYVYIENKNINLELVKSGLAVSETIQPNVKYQDQIINAQKQAQAACFGIWSNLCENQNQDNVFSGCIKIKEIHADAVGNDNINKNDEWIMLQNICGKNIDLDSWLLKDNSASNKYQFHDSLLEKYSFIQLFSGCGKDTKDKLYWQCPEQKYAVWNNNGDNAYLYNAQDKLVASYKY